MLKSIITLIIYIIIHFLFISMFYLIDVNNTELYFDAFFNSIVLSFLAPIVIIEVDLKLRKYIK